MVTGKTVYNPRDHLLLLVKKVIELRGGVYGYEELARSVEQDAANGSLAQVQQHINKLVKTLAELNTAKKDRGVSDVVSGKCRLRRQQQGHTETKLADSLSKLSATQACIVKMLANGELVTIAGIVERFSMQSDNSANAMLSNLRYMLTSNSIALISEKSLDGGRTREYRLSTSDREAILQAFKEAEGSHSATYTPEMIEAQSSHIAALVQRHEGARVCSILKLLIMHESVSIDQIMRALDTSRDSTSTYVSKARALLDGGDIVLYRKITALSVVSPRVMGQRVQHKRYAYSLNESVRKAALAKISKVPVRA